MPPPIPRVRLRAGAQARKAGMSRSTATDRHVTPGPAGLGDPGRDSSRPLRPPWSGSSSRRSGRRRMNLITPASAARATRRISSAASPHAAATARDLLRHRSDLHHRPGRCERNDSRMCRVEAQAERPLPAEASVPTPTWHWRDQAVTTWETKNPIFANDIILPWNWVGTEPSFNIVSDPDLFKDDFARARRIIAPVFTGGQAVLVTQTSKIGVNVWDIPEADLGKHNWSDRKAYAGSHVRRSLCRFPPGCPVGPFEGMEFRCPSPQQLRG